MAAQGSLTILTRAEMPMAGGEYQARLWRALDNGDSLYELMLELPRVADLLARDADLKKYRFRISNTVNSLSRALGDKWEVALLLHSMDMRMVRATILGTVAYDEYRGILRGYPNPRTESNAQGVYVVGLRRSGTGGKFLDREETERLIEGLEQYLEGCQVLSAPSGTRSRWQEKVARWVKEVDGMLTGRPAPGAPGPSHFVKSGADVVQVKALIRGFGKRLIRAPATGPDYEKNLRQVQSPLYVGCSTNLKARIADYNLAQHLRHVNKNLGLTASVLHALDLPVEPVARVAVRTWKASQLSLAEQLVATLASSLVHQCGFNAMETGGKSGSIYGLDEATVLVLGKCSFLRRNLQSTQEQFQRHREFERELDEAQDELAILEGQAAEAKRDISALQSLVEATSGQQLCELAKSCVASMEQLVAEVRSNEWLAEHLWALKQLQYPDAAAAVLRAMNDLD